MQHTAWTDDISDEIYAGVTLAYLGHCLSMAKMLIVYG